MSVRWAYLSSASVFLAFAAPLLSQNNRTLLRVIDSATSKPIALAEVRDVIEGTTLRTSDAGLVVVRFVNRETKRLLVRRVGYESKGIAVNGGASDTVRVDLVPVTQTLAPISVEASRDRRLELAGFYERKRTAATSLSHFITSEDINRWKPTLLSDLRVRMGLSQRFEQCAVYVDGVPTRPTSTRGNTFRRGLDADIQPADISALEWYRVAEAPIQFTPTQGRRPECVFLVWLK